jgi:hypothetical protein
MSAKISAFALALMVISGATARGQSAADGQPQQGSREIQIWTGAGHSLDGGAHHTGVWDGGLRYGWVLTKEHGPGILRGRFEYAVDAVPLYVIFQPSGVVYGAGVNPFALKWLFTSGRRITPYFDMGGGVLFTSSDVPAGITRINFASGPAIGVNVRHGKAHWSLEVRWLHISDAGLTDENPGINIIQLRAGLGWFQRKE